MTSVFALQKTTTTCLIILTLMVICAALHYAKAILVPITLAWLLSVLLAPVVRYNKRHHVPEPLSAAAIVTLLLMALMAAVKLLSEPASRWFRQLPEKLHSIQEKLYLVQEPLTDLQEVGDQVALMTTTDKDVPIAVAIQESSWVESLIINDLPLLSSSLLIVIVLTFFLLSSSDHFLRQLTKIGDTWSTKRQLIKAVKGIRQELSIYLRTVFLINAGLALAVGIMLWLVDAPNPLFWGIVAGLLNFAPYVGPLITAILLALVGMTGHDSLSAALLAPGLFIVLSTIEGQLVTPTVVGRRLSLAPTAVFIAVIFWTWLWGVAGALMAAPLLASIKILCENLPALRGFNHLIES
jgi:predicted PurR-regulated permease PerM